MSDEPEPVKSVLVRAVESGDLDAVRAAVEAAGDTEARYVAVNAEDKGTWRSPLHWSASFGLVDVTRLLIELGGDPNAEDIKGRTSLHYACDAYRNDLDGDLRYEDGITQLVAHGAFSLEDMTGKLPDAGDQSSGFVKYVLYFPNPASLFYLSAGDCLSIHRPTKD